MVGWLFYLIYGQHQLTNFGRCRTWALEQVASRREENSRPLHACDQEVESRSTGEEDGDREPSMEELLALGRETYQKGKGKGKSKTFFSRKV